MTTAPASYPVRLEIDYPEKLDRFTTFFRFIWVIPVAVVLGFASANNLWIAIAAGFSSSINQIDPATGAIKRSIFAECEPRGIDIKDGVLYTVCFNGEHLPAKIDRRTIVDQNHEMLRSRQFILDVDLSNY